MAAGITPSAELLIFASASLALLPSAALARDGEDDGGAGGPDTHIASDDIAAFPEEVSGGSGLAPAAAVSIVKPIGSVRIAGAGDELGRARRGRRTTENGVVTLDFTPSWGGSGGRAYAGVSLPAGMPLSSARLTSSFGYRYHPVSGRYRRHSGIDLAAPRGTPIVATSDGVVLASGWMGGYGIAVRLDHGAGTETRYAHMSRTAVAPGQDVKRGQVIGYVGSTGRSTGPHLHYEIRKKGRAVNPMP